jgi:hypothetical protein
MSCCSEKAGNWEWETGNGRTASGLGTLFPKASIAHPASPFLIGPSVAECALDAAFPVPRSPFPASS